MRQKHGTDNDPDSSAPQRRTDLLPALLRAWRLEAGHRLKRGKPLTQLEVATEVGVSERWYRNLEGGEQVALNASRVSRLADALALGPDERMALYSQTLGGMPSDVASSGRDEEVLGLHRLADTATTNLAYLTDAVWNIVDYNSRMAEWFPWVRSPEANLMHWIFHSPESRKQLVDWEKHAEIYLAQLRFALACEPRDYRLESLLQSILVDPECRRMWERETRVVAYRQGHRYRLRLPHVSSEELEVTSQVLLPAYCPDLRLVMVVPSEQG
ncbi:helix-turn-helix transcriptional regulator [Streptomyces sp. NPDC050315]|uniref:helix-turn-helix transcriptional regulator n=1 Tax=Streptomyces sp. NPDC050315 TaxID=3155039 RepID=UPI003425E92D